MIKAAIFDWGYTIRDHENNRIFPEAIALLEILQNQGIILVLISRAVDVNKRWEEFRDSSMEKYFQEMDVIPRENTKEFLHILNKIGVKPEETLIIGDRIKSEIVEGNKIGAITVWFRNGKFADEFPDSEEEKPDYTITSFKEVVPIIQKLNK